MENRSQVLIDQRKQQLVTAIKYGITLTDLEVWQFLDGYIKQYGYAPSYQEIADACFVSITTVSTCLKHLDGKNYIRRHENHLPRAMTLLLRPACQETAVRQ